MAATDSLEPASSPEFEENLEALANFSTRDREDTIRGLAQELFPNLPEEAGQETVRREIIEKLTAGPSIHMAEVKETRGITLETLTLSSLRPIDLWYIFRYGEEADQVNEQNLAALREEVEKNSRQYAEAVLEAYLKLGDFESFWEVLAAMGYQKEKFEEIYQKMAAIKSESYPDITNAAYFMSQDEKSEPLYPEAVVEQALTKYYEGEVFVYESEEADPKVKSATMLLFVDEDTGLVQLKACLITGKEKEGTKEAGHANEADKAKEEKLLEGLRIHERTHLVYAAQKIQEGEVIRAVSTYDGPEWVARAAQGTTYKEALFFAAVSEASYRLTNRIDQVFVQYRKEGETIEDYRTQIQNNESGVREALISAIQEEILRDANPEKEAWTIATPIPGSGILTYGPFFKMVYGADIMKALLLKQEADRRALETPEELIDLAREMEKEGRL